MVITFRQLEKSFTAETAKLAKKTEKILCALRCSAVKLTLFVLSGGPHGNGIDFTG